nr:hypothetical protein [Proteiniclasticum ruminis]
MSIWGDWAGAYGNLGGWFAAVAIIGPMWFLNHYIGLVDNPGDHAFVDIAWGIAWVGIMRDVFGTGDNAFDLGRLVSSLPTIGLLTVGALLAGLAINAFNKAK